MSKKYRDEDMIAYKGGGDDHMSKRKQRNKALEIVFDPSAHKEYITGFRKRKQARRKDALSNLEKKQRQQRIEERAERRLAQKEQLNLAKYSTDSDQEEEDNGVAKRPQVQVYNAGGLTSTVTVAPIKVGSDSELEDNNDEEDYDDDALPEMPAAAQARKMEKEKQRARDREREEASRTAVAPTKLSKTSLRVMLKTKAKIAGKKTVGRKAAGLQPGKKGGGGDRGGDRGGKGGRKGRR
ncbi:hypothetical protein Ndes2526B_g04897 [Nannochloris sp. 'desiccata']